MRKAAFVVLAVGAATMLALFAARLAPSSGTASSHREAPLISEDPTADNTDLYAFIHPNDPDELNIISNWIPAEDTAAGPMWYTFSPRARYNIYIDRTGDARPDVTYRFRFSDAKAVAFLRDTVQSYTVTRIKGGKSEVVARGVTPPNNVGPRFLKTFFGTEDYRTIAAKGVVRQGGKIRFFAGQRDDAFFGDIGAIFDVLGFRRGIGNQGGGKDFFAGYAVHTIALHIPVKELDTKNHVIGIWSTTDRLQISSRTGKSQWVQVSRLGNPLINEVIIPTEDKDRWNSTSPAQDAQFAKYYRSPVLAALINQFYNLGVKTTDRNDLVQALLTGVPGLNKTGNTLADMLRINLAVKPTALNKASRMGVLGGDLAGFPNGRRLEDDVIDIAEQVVAGALINPPGKTPPLGDGVNGNDVPNLSVFPYEPDPASGFANPKGQQKP